MSDENVEIRIGTSYDGHGAKEAAADQEKLRQEASSANAEYNRQMNQSAARAMQGDGGSDRRQVLRGRIRGSYAKEAEETNNQAWRDQERIQRLQFDAAQKTKSQEERVGKAGEADNSRKWRDQERIQRLQFDAAEKTRRAEEAAHAKAEQAEQRRQASVEKAQNGWRNRVGHAGAGLAESTIGGSQFGGIISALTSGGGMAALAGGAVAAVAAGLAMKFGEQAHEQKLIGLRADAAETVQNRHLARQASFEGSSGGSREQAESYRDEIIRLDAERKVLEEKAKFRWSNPMSWVDQITGASRNELDANARARDLAAKGEGKSRETQREKFGQFGASEIAMAERQAALDYKGARAIQDKLTYAKEYQRIQGEGGSNEEAQRGAEAKIANIQRERMGGFAGLIDARDGKADVARIAGLSMQQRFAGGVLGGGDTPLDKLIGTMQQHHGEVMNVANQKRFSRG